MRNYLLRKSLIKLYYAFVHPYGLEVYGTVNKAKVYGTANKAKLDKLCKLNNKLLRILLHKNFATPIVDLYVKMKTLRIPILPEKLLLLFVHKYVYHKQLLPDLFKIISL